MPDDVAISTSNAAELVDRDADLARVDELLRGAVEGSGAIAVLEGPAGIGKSAVLAETSARAAALGATVLRARGSELEREFPFGIVRQLFETALADPAARERRLTGAAAAAAPVFLAPGAAATEGGSFATLHGLYWLAADLAAEGPLVLAIDDLHWCDAASLAPLTQAATATLVRRRLGSEADEAFCAACHEVSTGNPLLLGQLLGALRADGTRPVAAEAAAVRDIGPRAVSRSVLLRLARLPEDAVALAQAVSILGDDAPLEMAAALAGLDAQRAVTATGPLVRAEILGDELPLRFVHLLVRDAVYRELAGAERVLRHARAAELLRDAGAGVEQLAAQLLLAPARGDLWVARFLHDAGLDAVARGAPDSATAYLRRALQEPPEAEQRPRILYDLGRVEVLTDGAAAAEHLREAHATLREPIIRAHAAQHLARVLILLNRPEEAQDLAAAIRAELPAGEVDLRYTLEALERIAGLFGGRPPAGPGSMDGRTGGLGGTVGEKRILAVTALERCFTGASAQECCALALEALADGILIPADDTFLMCCAAIVLLEADHPEVMAVWDEASADAHRRGSVFAQLGTNLWRGNALLRNGELPDAEASLARAAEVVRQWGDATDISATYLAAFQTEVLVERGELERARAALGDRPTNTLNSDARRLWQGAQIRLLLAEKRHDHALEGIESYRQMLVGLTNPAWNQWRSMRATALFELGRRDEAVELMLDELADAERWGAPGTVGRSLRMLGELERDETRLRDAADLLATSSARLEHAKALLGLGTVIRQQRRPTDAREPLRAAYELATACGSDPVAERARAELHATGARPRTTALSGTGALTPSERRVAGLAAEGRSNRDIAQELFVTQKTVEVHLSNAYRKLGIGSRRELASALATG